jgi:hypothetical protein
LSGHTVYAAVCPKFATIKIGASDSPWARVGDLMTSAPGWIFLWAVWPGGFAAERAAHRALAAHRHKGEWFNAHPDVVAYVLEQARPEWARAVREDFRRAGAILGNACSWAADCDEGEDGKHRHRRCSVVGFDADWPLPKPPQLREGFQHVPGPLVPEQWFNDLGSEYWCLATPVVAVPSPRSIRPKRTDAANPRQPSLFDKVRP